MFEATYRQKKKKKLNKTKQNNKTLLFALVFKRMVAVLGFDASIDTKIIDTVNAHSASFY